MSSATPPLFFTDATALRGWFAEHAAVATELMVGFFKTHTGQAALTWPQAVDEALCFGWIDGVRTRIDENRYKIRFSPRQPRSRWSTLNINRIPELEAAGKMTDAGRAVFAQRIAARSQTASYEQSAPAELSAEEIAEFRQNPVAWAFYERLPAGYRHKANWYVVSAKRPVTREKRFLALIQASAEGRREHEWKTKPPA